jgi:hypothetical protein
MFSIEVGVFLIYLWLEPFGLFCLGFFSDTVTTSDTRQDLINTGHQLVHYVYLHVCVYNKT